jgi:hypothetical protein
MPQSAANLERLSVTGIDFSIQHLIDDQEDEVARLAIEAILNQ